MRRRMVLVAFAMAASGTNAQVDPARAEAYFSEARLLCERDGGALWGVSLCGPMAIADAATQTLATTEPQPNEPWPRALGYANTAIEWGGQRWSTYVWSFISADDSVGRGTLFMHELFHRVQPELALMAFGAGNTDHLDTLDGRYWLQLEWRALAAALAGEGAARRQAIADAAAFRLARRSLVSELAASTENADEIREGLAQYTGVVLTATDSAAAVRKALEQLLAAPQQPTFVRSFAPVSGTAYGILLDAYSADWRRRLTPESDLGAVLAAAASVPATADPTAAAQRYDATALRAGEEARELERRARMAELVARFVDGAVVRFPRPRSASLITTGSVPIPGAGTVFLEYHASGPWGSIDVDRGGVLVGDDDIAVPAPRDENVRALAGDGWRATLADGWIARPGERAGDYVIVEAAD
jgi:hypothetical protein